MYADSLKHWMYAVYTYKKVYLKAQSHLHMQNYTYTYVCKYVLPHLLAIPIDSYLDIYICMVQITHNLKGTHLCKSKNTDGIKPLVYTRVK